MDEQDLGESAADGFIEPHIQVFHDLLCSAPSPAFVRALDTAAAYATCHSNTGAFPEPGHMRTLLDNTFVTAKACLSRATSLQTVQCPELQAVALLLERLPAPQHMAWFLCVCATQLQQLPLEHLLDRVRERAVVAARVSQRLLEAVWFDPALPAAAPQHGCNLLDRFLYALIIASASTGVQAVHGVWNHTSFTMVPWRAPLNIVPDSMVAHGPSGVLASVALAETFINHRGAALFSALLPPQPPPPQLLAGGPAAAAPMDPITHAHAAAVRKHRDDLVSLIPVNKWLSSTPAFVPCLMRGLRPSELVALVVLITPTSGLVCPHSGLPMPPGGWPSTGYPVPAQQARERTAQRRAPSTVAARSSMSVRGGAEVDPRLYVQNLLLGPDPFLNAALAPGVLLPAAVLPDRQQATSSQSWVEVKIIACTSADGQPATSGAASVAVRAISNTASATAYVNAHLRFMLEDRAGVILAGREEAALRKHAPRLLVQLLKTGGTGNDVGAAAAAATAPAAHPLQAGVPSPKVARLRASTPPSPLRPPSGTAPRPPSPSKPPPLKAARQQVPQQAARLPTAFKPATPQAAAPDADLEAQPVSGQLPAAVPPRQPGGRQRPPPPPPTRASSRLASRPHKPASLPPAPHAAASALPPVSHLPALPHTEQLPGPGWWRPRRRRQRVRCPGGEEGHQAQAGQQEPAASGSQHFSLRVGRGGGLRPPLLSCCCAGPV